MHSGGWAAYLCLLLPLNLAACKEGSPAPSQQTDHTASAIGERPGLGERTEPIVSIGVADGDDAQIFGKIETMVADAEGRIVVLDGQMLDIRVFGPDGRFFDRVGGAGDGPGEFRAPFDVVARPHDTILVVDGSLHRITAYHLSHERMDLVSVLRVDRFPVQLCPWPDGRFLTLAPSKTDGFLLHWLDAEGHTLGSFGELLTNLAPELAAEGWDVRSSQNHGPLVCDDGTRAIYTVAGELGYARKFDGAGRELWRTRLSDYHQWVWVHGLSPGWYAEVPDPETGIADLSAEAFFWAADTLAVSVKRNPGRSAEKTYQVRLLDVDSGAEIARMPTPMIAAAADSTRIYGYVNEPYPRIMIFSRTAPAAH